MWRSPCYWRSFCAWLTGTEQPPALCREWGGKEWGTVFLSGRLIWKAEALVILIIPNATVRAFWRTAFPLSLLPVSSLVKTDPRMCHLAARRTSWVVFMCPDTLLGLLFSVVTAGVNMYVCLAAWHYKCSSLCACREEINDGLLWKGCSALGKLEGYVFPEPDARTSEKHKEHTACSLHVVEAQGKTENYFS